MSGLHRHSRNPILTRADIPRIDSYIDDVTSVFNPGAVRLDAGSRVDRLLLRVQTRGRETVLLVAESPDGESFAVLPERVEIDGVASLKKKPIHVYDPRVTQIDGVAHVVLSVDTEDGCFLLTTRWESTFRLRVVGWSPERESRNGVLFPERIGGKYCRLERPNEKRLASGVRTGDEIWLATSDDLRNWALERPVIAGRWHYWDELIGSGPPPIKTREGWLHVYHGVATHLGGGIYQAGVVLLDLSDPSRVLARGRNNILEPREPYEMVGQVPNVVFPSGIIVESVDGEGFALTDSVVRIYYGAADTSVCLAETTVRELLDASRLQ
ncbi:MAG: glycoside hydrolase family 130 protein [Candidatus Eisenbacteria bacterium]